MSSLTPVKDNSQSTSSQVAASLSDSAINTAPSHHSGNEVNICERPSRLAIPQWHFTPSNSSIGGSSLNNDSRFHSQTSQSPISTPPTPPTADTNQPIESTNNRSLARQTLGERMNNSVRSFRHRATERMQASKTFGGTKERTSNSTSANTAGTPTSMTRSMVSHSRPNLAQFRKKDQPSKMIIPPPYGQDRAYEAAVALADGIPDGIPRSNTGSHSDQNRALSDPETTSSDDEPEVKVQIEIHLQGDSETKSVCPLSEKDLDALAQRLDFTPQERAEVGAIHTKEELVSYLKKLPRDYEVTIVASNQEPDSSGATFDSNDHVHKGESVSIIRRETIKEKKSRRRKQKYRRPTTDLSALSTEEPRASWLELFFDLLFVANLNNFTHGHPITGGAALGHYIGWFVILWWVWAGQTFWAARYDMDDLFTRLCNLVEFCALIEFGSFSSDYLDHTATEFIVTYIVLKAVLVVEYGNVLFWAMKNRSSNSLMPLLLHIGSNMLAMLIWGLSIMVHSGAWRYVMWYITIAIEVSVLVSFGRRTSVTFAGSHLPERFALFTIIVFGENIIGLLALSSGAVFWDGVHGVFICLFLLLTIILYGLWWIYFDDFSEDIFRETTTLSQLWAYLHLPLHLCIVLVGSGALDLIRLYKQENHIEDYPSSSSSTAEHFIIPEYQSLRFFPKGFEVPFEQRPAMVAAAGAFPDRHIDYRLTKRYFLVACSLVFLFNSLIKWINLRSYDRFQKVVYLSRLLNAILILCLLAVPLDKMTPFALLGSMALFCALQVAVDLAVIYFGAYGFVEDVEAWAKSSSSSSDLGNFPRSPLSIGPHPRSVTSSRRGSVVDSHVPSKGSATNTQYNARSYNAQQNQSCQNHYQQKQLLSQSQTSPLSQHQQQALFNMHVNANSLGSSGAYGNLVQTLAEIKKREQWDQHSKDGLLPSRQISLRGVEQESSANKPSSQKAVKFHKHSGIGQNRLYLSKNTDASLASSAAHVSTSFTLSGDEQSSLRSSDGHGSGAIGLAALFNQQPTTP